MNRLWVRMCATMVPVIVLAGMLPLLAILLVVVISTFFTVDGSSATGIVDYFDSYWSAGFDQRLDETINLLFNETGNALLTALVLALGMGLGAGVWVSRLFARPIKELADGTDRLRREGLGYQVTLSDRSDEVQNLARDFNAMSAELAHAEQLRRNLMTDVSHELRTPLTVLEGKLRAALDQVHALDEGAVANLYSQTTHLIKLVEDLHLLARAEAAQLPLQRESADLILLLREVVWNFELVATEQDVALSLEVPDSLVVAIDFGRIRQIVSNLVSNALRHTPAGGSVVVSATATPTQAEITIQDSGEGIDADHLAHIFDRFYRTDSSRTRASGGSGLGLAIVKALVDAHDGEIFVQSNLRNSVDPASGSDQPSPQGTIFTIQLPIK